MAKEVQSNGDQPQENPAEDTGQSNNTLTSISLGLIYPSKSTPQTRRRLRFKDGTGGWKFDILELVESLKVNGLVNPITVRSRSWTPHFTENSRSTNGTGGYWGAMLNKGRPDWLLDHICKNSEAEAQDWCDAHKYEVVAGERRFIAAGIAGFTEIQCVVRELSDERMLEIQLVENVQREDVNPVDEALWYSEMTKNHNWTLPEIAARVGKDPRYIQTRLKLMAAVPEVLQAVEDKFLPMTHALEIAKLDEDSQKQIFSNAFQTEQNFIEGKWQHQPIMTKVVSFTELKNKIAGAFFILKGAIFDVKNKNLRADGLKCGDCNQRTGSAGTLFEEYKFDDGDRCLDSLCFRNKTKVHLANVLEKRGIKIRKDHALEDDFNPAILISTQHDAPLDVLTEWFPNEEVLKVSSYNSDSADARSVDKPDGKCTGLEYGIWMDWNNKGNHGVAETVAICRRSSCCKKHWSASSSSYSSSTTPIKDLPAAEQETRRRERGARRQQILDSQVLHAVAPQAFRDVCLKYGDANDTIFDSMVLGDFHFMLGWMTRHLRGSESGLFNWVLDKVFKSLISKGNYSTLTKSSWEKPDYVSVFEGWEQKLKVSYWFAFTQCDLVRHYGDDLKPEHFESLYKLCGFHEIEWIGYDAQARKSMTPAKYSKETDAFVQAVTKYLAESLNDPNAVRPERPFIYATDQQKEEIRKQALLDTAREKGELPLENKIGKPKKKEKASAKCECGCFFGDHTGSKTECGKCPKGACVIFRKQKSEKKIPVETPGAKLERVFPPVRETGEITTFLPNHVIQGFDDRERFEVINPEVRIDFAGRWIEIRQIAKPDFVMQVPQVNMQFYHGAKIDPNDDLGIGEATDAAESDLELEDFDDHEEIDENDLDETSQG